VVHVVRRGGDHEGGIVGPHDLGQLARDPVGGETQVVGKGDLERWVEYDREEGRPS